LFAFCFVLHQCCVYVLKARDVVLTIVSTLTEAESTSVAEDMPLSVCLFLSLCLSVYLSACLSQTLPLTDILFLTVYLQGWM